MPHLVHQKISLVNKLYLENKIELLEEQLRGTPKHNDIGERNVQDNSFTQLNVPSLTSIQKPPEPSLPPPSSILTQTYLKRKKESRNNSLNRKYSGQKLEEEFTADHFLRSLRSKYLEHNDAKVEIADGRQVGLLLFRTQLD